MSELSALKQAQYHLKELEGHIKDNKWYSHLYSHLAAVEGELQRQVETLEGTKVKILDNSAAGEIPVWVENATVASHDWIDKCSVKVTFDPPWGQHMMSDEAKLELGML